MSVSGEHLIGGSGSGARRRKMRAAEELPPPMIGLRFVAVLVVVGGCFLALGMWRVGMVFAARDFEMEASRLQVLAEQRRDRAKGLATRISALQRGEVLRGAAEGTLGMAPAEPGSMDTLDISAESVARWRAAAEAARVGTAITPKEEKQTLEGG